MAKRKGWDTKYVSQKDNAQGVDLDAGSRTIIKLGTADFELALPHDEDVPFPKDFKLHLQAGDKTVTVARSAAGDTGDGYLSFRFRGVKPGVAYTLQSSGAGKQRTLFKDAILAKADGSRARVRFLDPEDDDEWAAQGDDGEWDVDEDEWSDQDDLERLE